MRRRSTHSTADRRIQLGLKITQGLGAGSRPEIGRAAAEETLDEIMQALEGAHMCFIAAGMGGGTGTGAAPVIAKAARDKGILTVGVVTKPFAFEGSRRGRSADSGIAELQQHVDTLIVIPNQNLFRLANSETTFKEAFEMADEVLQQGVRGITDLMVMPGLINLDFADVRSVMSEMGKAMMGTGEADGDNRAIEAAEKAISNPLLDGVSMKGAKGVIISITGGEDMRLMEVDEAASHIKELVDPDANIIWGSAFNNDLGGKIRVSVVATGIEAEVGAQPQPAKVFSFPARHGRGGSGCRTGRSRRDARGRDSRPKSAADEDERRAAARRRRHPDQPGRRAADRAARGRGRAPSAAPRPAAAPCSSACRTSRAARPRRSSMTRTSRATSATRSTSRASSTARTTSKLPTRFDEGRSAGAALFRLRQSTSLPPRAARLTVNPLGRKLSARFCAARGGMMRGLLQFRVAGALVACACGARGRRRPRRRAAIRPTTRAASAALARYVRTLASDPKDFESLIGAGRAALELGDAQAAAGFFARADEVNPQQPAAAGRHGRGVGRQRRPAGGAALFPARAAARRAGRDLRLRPRPRL